MNIDNDCISPDQVYDVLIVGAGPVGLATAIALRKRGINNILVIDQTREFRRVGQIVDLLPNGLKAIKYIAPEAYQHLKEFEQIIRLSFALSCYAFKLLVERRG